MAFSTAIFGCNVCSASGHIKTGRSTRSNAKLHRGFLHSEVNTARVIIELFASCFNRADLFLYLVDARMIAGTLRIEPLANHKWLARQQGLRARVTQKRHTVKAWLRRLLVFGRQKKLTLGTCCRLQ